MTAAHPPVNGTPPVAGDLGRHALAYAREGIHVFPLVPRQKEPLTKHGFLDATTNEVQVRKWWTDSPTANIGARGLNFFAVDIDPRHGGTEQWEAITAQHAVEPVYTRENCTGRGDGGRHLLFRPLGFDFSKFDLAPGIEVLHQGAYILLPPSIHPVSGNPYQWRDEYDAISECPSWLGKLIADKVQELATRPVNRFALPETIAEGERDKTLFGYACSLRAAGGGMDEAEILAALRAVNEARCRPPLSDKDVQAKVASACRYPKGSDQARRAGTSQDATPDTQTGHINVTGRQLRDVTHDALEALRVGNEPPRLFVRGPAMARVQPDHWGRMLISDASEGFVRGRMARTADWMRWTKRAKEESTDVQED